MLVQLNRNTSNQHHKNYKDSDYLNLLEGIFPPKHECMGIKNARFI